MRHFFCSNAIEIGVDFKTIAYWLGHTDGGVLVARNLRAFASRAQRPHGDEDDILDAGANPDERR